MRKSHSWLVSVNEGVLLVLVSVTFCSSFPAAARKGRWEGEANTADISFSVNRLSYDSVTLGCRGGMSGLTSTSIRLEYRTQTADNESDSSTSSPWMTCISNIPLGSNHNFSSADFEGVECVEYRLVQEEHGGGYCNCWNISGIEVNSTTILQ